MKIITNISGLGQTFKSMKALVLFTGLVLAVIPDCVNFGSHSKSYEKYDAAKLKIVVSDWSTTPILTSDHPQTSDIKYGFEGGYVIKMNGKYQLITLEKIDAPPGVKNRIAYWESPDGNHWSRKRTLLESSGDTTGTDSQASVFSPMPVFDPQSDYWYLFYAAYYSNPSMRGGWYERYHGKILQAKSRIKGSEGFSGPYVNPVVVLTSDPSYNPWEGLQGITGFSPFQVKDQWMVMYGSAKTEETPVTSWKLGLARADSLTAVWKKLKESNPVALPVQAESPLVHRLHDSCYVCFFDEITGGDYISYLTSKDGLDWNYGGPLQCLPENDRWWREMRAPIGMIDEGDGKLTLYFTAYNSAGEFAALGKLNLQLSGK